MMKKFVFLFLFTSMANAAPFIVSDSYPATDPLPDTCSYQDGTAAIVTAPAVKDATGTYCKFDIASSAVGAHSLQVWATSNVWGASAKVPFTYTRPAQLRAPANIGLVAQ